MEFSLNAMETNFLNKNRRLSLFRERYFNGEGSIHSQNKSMKQKIMDTYDEEEEEIMIKLNELKVEFSEYGLSELMDE